jgi:hypothetical protein
MKPGRLGINASHQLIHATRSVSVTTAIIPVPAGSAHVPAGSAQSGSQGERPGPTPYHSRFNPDMLDRLMHGRYRAGGASFWFEQEGVV